jgi:AraC-like DNA-binding protein
MSLQTYIPHPLLRDSIEMLWYWEGYHPPHPKERILPGGMMELTINLCDRPFRLDYPRTGSAQQITGPIAAGPRSEHFVIDTKEPASILAAWFKPGGALRFFGVSAAEIHNLHVPLDILWGRASHELYEKLLQAQSLRERFFILETALCQRLFRGPQQHGAVDYALTVFQKPHGSIADVVERTALSPTRFIQVFREEVGMTPKRFCRVQRFQKALRIMAEKPGSSQVEVALACGYYDQAHFINEFRAFAGITPAEFRPQSREHTSNLPYID